jgi:hypothetical protein
MGIADANYYVNILVKDSAGNTKFDSSDNNVHINPAADSCTCPTSGTWNIKDGDICTLTTTCNLNNGDMHVSNGSLTIATGGTLVVPAGKNVIIERTTGTMVIQGGKMVIVKTGASPFVYIMKDGSFEKASDFVPGATAKEKEYTSYTDITKADIVDNKVTLKITEELDELAYIDKVFLRLDQDNNRIIELESVSYADKSLLTKSDDKYLAMPQGTEHILEFIVEENYKKLEFGAEAYYIEKPEKQALPLIAKGKAKEETKPIWPICLFFAYLIAATAIQVKHSEVKKKMGEQNPKHSILGKIAQLMHKISRSAITQGTKTGETKRIEDNLLSQRSPTNKALCRSHLLSEKEGKGLILGFLSQKTPIWTVLAITLLMLAPLAMAIPELFTVQGVLRDSSGNTLSGDYDFEFILYDGNTAGKNILWSEAQELTVSDGVFNAILGDLNTQKYLSALDFNGNMWLGLLVEGEEQTPLTRFTSIGSSFVAKKAMEVDLNAFQDFSDFNKWYESVFDLNNNYYQKQDINANFVPYIEATKDLNMGVYSITSNDLNAMNFGIENNAYVLGNLFATTYYGDGSNLTGIAPEAALTKDSTLDTNAAANTSWLGTAHSFTADQNFTNIGISGIIYGSNTNLDLNILNDIYLDNNLLSISNITAITYFGDGSNLTGVLTSASMLPDTTLDTNGTADQNWLSTKHAFTHSQQTKTS